MRPRRDRNPYVTHCLVSQLVWTPACRAEEMGSKPIRGAKGLSEGRETDSKSVQLGSIPSRPATGSDAEGCCFPDARTHSSARDVSEACLSATQDGPVRLRARAP